MKRRVSVLAPSVSVRGWLLATCKRGKIVCVNDHRIRNAAQKVTSLAKTVAGEAAHSVGERIADFKDSGLNKLSEALSNFNAMVPALREAGYALLEVEVTLGVPPSVIAKFSTPTETDEVKMTALLEHCANNKLASVLVRSLFEATKLQNKISVVGLAPRTISLDLGLIPTVGISFN